MARQPLDRSELERAVAALDGWTIAADGKSIRRSFRFADFNAAFAFMTRVAMQAEKIDHHPDWSNVYRNVEVSLSTHDAGGVTGLDIELARFMDGAAR